MRAIDRRRLDKCVAALSGTAIGNRIPIVTPQECEEIVNRVLSAADAVNREHTKAVSAANSSLLLEIIPPDSLALARALNVAAFWGAAQHRLIDLQGEFTPAPLYLEQAAAIFADEGLAQQIRKAMP